MWRRMEVADLAAVERISTLIHPNYYESPEVFAERHRLFPEGCFVAVGKEGVAGYCISHPWRICRVPTLNTLVGELPSDPDCLFIHDVALLPSSRGKRLASLLVEDLGILAGRAGLSALAGVAVYKTLPYWERMGFKTTAIDPAQLMSYGKGADYIVRVFRHP